MLPKISFSEYWDNKLSAHGLSLRIKHYLIELLCSYIPSKNFFETQEQQYQEKSLSDLYEKSQKALSLKEKNRIFKSIGDFSLCLSGFFRESLQKKLVNLSYYQDLGQGAYYRVSQSYQSKANIFQELAKEFPSLSKILFSIHKESLGQSQNRYLLKPSFKKNH